MWTLFYPWGLSLCENLSGNNAIEIGGKIPNEGLHLQFISLLYWELADGCRGDVVKTGCYKGPVARKLSPFPQALLGKTSCWGHAEVLCAALLWLETHVLCKGGIVTVALEAAWRTASTYTSRDPYRAVLKWDSRGLRRWVQVQWYCKCNKGFVSKYVLCTSVPLGVPAMNFN